MLDADHELFSFTYFQLHLGIGTRIASGVINRKSEVRTEAQTKAQHMKCFEQQKQLKEHEKTNLATSVEISSALFFFFHKSLCSLYS